MRLIELRIREYREYRVSHKKDAPIRRYSPVADLVVLSSKLFKKPLKSSWKVARRCFIWWMFYSLCVYFCLCLPLANVGKVSQLIRMAAPLLSISWGMGRSHDRRRRHYRSYAKLNSLLHKQPLKKQQYYHVTRKPSKMKYQISWRFWDAPQR